MSDTKDHSCYHKLPSELHIFIAKYLSEGSIKTLRLAVPDLARNVLQVLLSKQEFSYEGALKLPCIKFQGKEISCKKYVRKLINVYEVDKLGQFPNLTTVHFSNFDELLKPGLLPSSLNSLEFDNHFTNKGLPIEPDALPLRLKRLTLNGSFKNGGVVINPLIMFSIDVVNHGCLSYSMGSPHKLPSPFGNKGDILQPKDFISSLK